MILKYASYTDKGQYRKSNEDRIYMATRDMEGMSCFCCVICDGVGGTDGGELASSIAVYNIKTWFETLESITKIDLLTTISNICSTINQGIVELIAKKGISMATTLSMVVIVKHTMYIAHIGDSRIYLLPARGKWKQLTCDEVAYHAVDKDGKLYEKSFLSNYIGKEKDLTISVSQGTIKAGMSLLMCTDGFYKKLEAQLLCKRIRHTQNELQLIELLENASVEVREQGEKDNITVGLIRAYKS